MSTLRLRMIRSRSPRYTIKVCHAEWGADARRSLDCFGPQSLSHFWLKTRLAAC